MPVPTLISDLSQTASSNYPAGSESPGTIDDYHRALCSFVAILRDTQAAKGANTDITSLAAVTGVTPTLLADNTLLATTEFVRNFRQAAQVLNSTTGAAATGTTLIPIDDGVRLKTEGDQYLSLAITPKSASSVLEIDVNLFVNISTANGVSAVLFRSDSATPLAVAVKSLPSQFYDLLSFRCVTSAGSTSAITFTVRAGGALAGTLTLNGVGGVRVESGVAASSITIKEYLP